MGVSRPQVGSFVIPDSSQTNVFRCGVCWGSNLAVYVEVAEGGVTTRVECCACGNYKEWWTPWNTKTEEVVSGSIN